jgi:hypothetical protein
MSKRQNGLTIVLHRVKREIAKEFKIKVTEEKFDNQSASFASVFEKIYSEWKTGLEKKEKGFCLKGISEENENEFKRIFAIRKNNSSDFTPIKFLDHILESFFWQINNPGKTLADYHQEIFENEDQEYYDPEESGLDENQEIDPEETGLDENQESSEETGLDEKLDIF